MSEECLIDAQGLSKKFSLSLNGSMHHGLKDSLRQLLRLPVNSDRLRREEFWAVQDVSFQVRRGDCLAIMGANGSGKTTLLRILNGIYAPDAGEVTMRGRVGALIAAGAGFSPVLTGRENIFVNGALLGMSRAQVHRQMDEIIAFAEIGDFIDSPVRHYSSGMQVRLGFAVAAVARPEVLLVDEVLAVGDMNFQKKCYEYLHQLKRSGTAIVLVSHSIGAVWALCDRGLYLQKGRLLIQGDIEEVLRAYLDWHRLDLESGIADAHQAIPSFPDIPTLPAKDLSVHSVRILDAQTNLPRSDLAFGNGFVLEAAIETRIPITPLILQFEIDALHYRSIAVLDNQECGFPMTSLQPGCHTFRVRVDKQNLMPGMYRVNLTAKQDRSNEPLFTSRDVCKFNIRQPSDGLLKAVDTAVLFLEHHFDILPTAQLHSLGA